MTYIGPLDAAVRKAEEFDAAMRRMAHMLESPTDAQLVEMAQAAVDIGRVSGITPAEAADMMSAAAAAWQREIRLDVPTLRRRIVWRRVSVAVLVAAGVCVYALRPRRS